jgi:hypothetical protein
MLCFGQQSPLMIDSSGGHWLIVSAPVRTHIHARI